MIMSNVPKPEDVQATFCLTLVDEWVRGGIEHAVVCPGSRSTPLALALEANPRVNIHVHLDERSAGFVGLGIALATGIPAIICVTSGTAAAELHPSVVEAHHQGVPLIVCTADRPSELRSVGAPQTVDQNIIYTTSARYYLDIPPAGWEMRAMWRSLAARAYSEALYSPYGPGPVHLNCQFREPLVGQYLDMPAGRPDGRMWHSIVSRRMDGGSVAFEHVTGTDTTGSSDVLTGNADEGLSTELLIHNIVSKAKGIIVVGQLPPDVLDERMSIIKLARALGWPLLADPLSMCRTSDPEVIAGADAILQDADVRSRLRPDAVIRFGKPWASKTLNNWLAELGDSGVEQLLVDPYWQWSDPGRVSSFIADHKPVSLLRAVENNSAIIRDNQDWLQLWQVADAAVQEGIDKWCMDHDEITGVGLAREVFARCAGKATLVVSSSMPVRDAERFAQKLESPPKVFSNRGANGIDGVVSTARGIAESGKWRQTVVWVGDLAFFHDLTALLRTAGQSTPDNRLTVIVMDNGGGGIFSFLSQAEKLDSHTMERLFTTKQEQNVVEIAKSLGAKVVSVDTMEGVRAALRDHVVGLEADGPLPLEDSTASTPVNISSHDISLITVIHANAPSVLESAQIQLELQRQISGHSLQAVIAESS